MKNNKLWVLAAVALAFVFIGCSSSTGDKPKEEEKTQSGTTQTAAAPTYTITIQSGIAHGSISASKTSGIKQGETVTLTITPAEYFEIDTLTVKNGETAVTVAANNSFTMPAGNVTINATFIYKFNQTVTYLPEGTGGTLGTSGTYVLFGDWPQTIKADNVDIPDDAEQLVRGGFTFFKGSDDFWYVECRENSISSTLNYSNGEPTSEFSILNPSYKWFRVEPIKWRVLNPDATGNEKKILFAEKILTASIQFFGGSNHRMIDSESPRLYSSNYLYSNVRAYLNGIQNQFVTDGGAPNTEGIVNWDGIGFLQSAFTSAAQGLIAETTVDNSVTSATDYNGHWSTDSSYTCDPTLDKIFLLSIRELTTPAYGFQDCKLEDSARIIGTTDYAKANFASQFSSNGVEAYGGHILTRSPMGSQSGDTVKSINYNGKSNNESEYPTSKSPGIIPALSLE